MTKKERRKIRSKKYHDMKPLVFSKLIIFLPYVMKVSKAL